MSVRGYGTGAGRRYEVRFRDGARHRSRSFERLADARLFDAETRRRKQLGSLAELTQASESLDDYVATTWGPSHGATLAPSTQKLYGWTYDQVISPTLGHVALRDITPDLIAAWQAQELRRGRGRETLRKAHQLLGTVLQRAVESGRIQSNPQRLVRRVKAGPSRRVVALAPASVERIRRALLDGRTKSLSPARDATLIAVMAYSGLRPGEALAMRWRDVGDATIVVDAPKTGQRRSVRLLAALAQDLREWRLMSGRPGPGALVFPATDGSQWTDEARKSWSRHAFAQAVEVAGVERLTPYGLRHSFASLLAHERRSGPYISAQLGHSLAVSTSTYQHVLLELEDQPAVTAEDAIREARDAPLRKASGE